MSYKRVSNTKTGKRKKSTTQKTTRKPKLIMRKKYHDDWLELPDGRLKQKRLGTKWIINLYYGTERGGMIEVWEKDVTYGSDSDDGKWSQFGEYHYMDWENALSSYQHNFSSVKEMSNFAWENR